MLNKKEWFINHLHESIPRNLLEIWIASLPEEFISRSGRASLETDPEDFCSIPLISPPNRNNFETYPCNLSFFCLFKARIKVLDCNTWENSIQKHMPLKSGIDGYKQHA